MQRYNQGFGGFGPMEKCGDGKWVKSAEVESAIRTAREMGALYERFWDEALGREIIAREKIVVCVGVAVSSWVIIAAALIRYAFIGHIL